MKKSFKDLPKTLRWEDGRLYLLDQTKLPLEVVEEEQTTIEQVWDSIKKLKVRGAPAIGVAGAYGVLFGVKDKTDLPKEEFIAKLKKAASYLNSSRPTAVNLSWALKRMVKRAETCGYENASAIYEALVEEAKLINLLDKELCRGIALNGADLIKDGMGVLTHCNAGALATSGMGTALAPIYLAHEKGINFKVFADETRPLLQGARLTSWELQRSNIDVTLLCDNMAAHIMSQGLIDIVIVGTDRVAANGDVANKIGTLAVAIAAKYFNIPFYVACPSSTIDFATLRGEDIIIENRGEEEVVHFADKRTAPYDMKVKNPAFDVTPNELVTGIITENGIVRAPYKENLRKNKKV